MQNRSVPCDTVLPHVVYDSVEEAIKWLNKTFGFVECYRYGDPAQFGGAQMRLGRAHIMLRKSRSDSATPKKLGAWTQSLTIFVDDVVAHFARAKAAGAVIVEELNVTPYGERQYGTVDMAGHLWLFSQHVEDVSPEQWGAVMSKTDHVG